MKFLSIDIETYSSNDINNGVYKYVDSEDFEILLFAYAFNDEPVKIVDLAVGEKLPLKVWLALQNDEIIKTAYNANFERTCIQKHFGIRLPYVGWECTMVHALEVGLPIGLGNVAKVLGLSEQKDTKGKNLIRYFTQPCTATQSNEGRTRNYSYHDEEKWEQFKDYCIQDVEVERDLRKYLSRYPMAESEKILWQLDQEINDRGVCVDTYFVRKVIKLDRENTEKKINRLKELTGLENPNSLVQLKNWLSEKTGDKIESLTKKDLPLLEKKYQIQQVLEVLRLKKEISKTSIKKYERMFSSACEDERIRGLLQFYGASRTGRWAGRLVQVQNLPQNHLEDIEKVRKDIEDTPYEMLSKMYQDLPSVLSQLVRTAFIPNNSKFIVSDFSAIEARVIAYLAGENWRLDVFKTHGKIYEASASQMFGIPIEEITKGSDLRQKGKIAELALGYGGGVGALKAMGALDMGLKEEELQPLVDSWRNANPNIKALWYACEKAALNAVKKGATTPFDIGITFYIKGNNLCIKLPSGRSLYYNSPSIGINQFGRECITYYSMNQTSKKWEVTETFGGKLVENIVQAVARDCLAESLKRLDKLHYEIVFHVHDEVILECSSEEKVEDVTEIMGREILWAKGLPLKADAYECRFYMKD